MRTAFNYKLLRDDLDERILPLIKEGEKLIPDQAYLCINRAHGWAEILYCRANLGADKQVWIQEGNSRQWAMPNNNQAFQRFDIYGPVDLSPEGLLKTILSAQRWEAMLAANRIRILGTANISIDDEVSPPDYAHFGAEFWTIHDHKEKPDVVERARSILTRFADKMHRFLKRHPETNNCGWCEKKDNRTCWCDVQSKAKEEKGD